MRYNVKRIGSLQKADEISVAAGPVRFDGLALETTVVWFDDGETDSMPLAVMQPGQFELLIRPPDDGQIIFSASVYVDEGYPDVTVHPGDSHVVPYETGNMSPELLRIMQESKLNELRRNEEMAQLRSQVAALSAARESPGTASSGSGGDGASPEPAFSGDAQVSGTTGEGGSPEEPPVNGEVHSEDGEGVGRS